MTSWLLFTIFVLLTLVPLVLVNFSDSLCNMVSYVMYSVTLFLTVCFMIPSADANGTFVYADSCDAISLRGDRLSIQPLEWRRLKVISSKPNTPVYLLSNSDKNCTLRPLFPAQAKKVGEDVDIKQHSHVCHFDKTHKELRAPPGTVTHVSCSEDENIAEAELNGGPEDNPVGAEVLPVRSREGKSVTDSSVSLGTEEITTQNKKHLSTKMGDEGFSTSRNLVSTTVISSSGEIKDTSIQSGIPLPPITLSSASPYPSTVEDDPTTDTFTDSEESSDPAVTTSVVTMTMVTVTIDPFFTSVTVFNANVPDIYVYTSIVVGALITIFIIVYTIYLINRRRTRGKNKEINQRLVQKRGNVINFRNAEEAVVQVNPAEVKYFTLGRKKTEPSVTLITEVPRCLKQ
ncbi:unnamed protein product [Meganyctiphanes norvegica]|uniref:Uncharacterized protein n=1 Tax=Meganyctiphanes norvegica TaxID=48144 RepID=A0AAV2S7R1_MEGNR